MVNLRFAQTPIDTPGTPEAAWQMWGVSFPTFSLLGCTHLVVVAPHPDDEILGVGGLMALAAAAGIRITVVAVTDGEASYPNSAALPTQTLAELRPDELRSALHELGITPRIVQLGLPDGRVTGYEDDLTTMLTEEFAQNPSGTWCAGPWRGDGHPDHDATGRACERACRQTRTRFVEYPVWMWHWAHPGDTAVPWSAARTVRLPIPIRHAKALAVSRFRSQLDAPPDDPNNGAILPRHVLARLLRSTETVFA
jgi:LmbE family N-acetylglucosaminyl deacetylase